MAIGIKQRNTETTCSTAGTQRSSFGATSQFQIKWRPFCFSKDLGQGKIEVLVAKNEKKTLNENVRTAPCVKHAVPLEKRIVPLQTIKGGIRFSKVAADILRPVTRAKTRVAKCIPVLTDYFKKYVICVPLQKTTTEDVANAIVKNWVLTFGSTDCHRTDQGAKFCSELLPEVCEIFEIENTGTSPYHPKVNGMIERLNRIIADNIS